MKITGSVSLDLLATKRATWRLRDPIRVTQQNTVVTVPAGWVTDLTSIPWWLPFRRREGTHTLASIVHDYLYAKGEVVSLDTIGHHHQTLSIYRVFADQFYRDVMVELGVGRYRRNLIYRGVRLGGWVPWNKYRRMQRAGNVD